MRILAIEQETPGATADQFRPLLEAEATRVWQLQQAGVIRDLAFVQGEHRAVITLECADPAEAGRTLASLPLVQAGLIRFDLLPLVPYPGLARLFRDPR